MQTTIKQTQEVMLQRWYIPDPVFGSGAAVYAGRGDPNGDRLVCDCAAITDLELWDGDPYMLAGFIVAMHDKWLREVRHPQEAQ